MSLSPRKGSKEMGVRIIEQNGIPVALLEGDIDHHTARHMREQIDDYIERKHPKRLHLDFGGIQFMDSSGIGLIMGRYRLMKLFGGELQVVGATDSVKRIIKLSGLGTLGVMK